MLTATCAIAAGSLQVSNVLLELPQTDTAQGLWLSNEGETPLRAQSRVLQWTQDSTNGDQLTASTMLTASPPLVEIAPGERQFVRVVRLQKGDPQTEQAYRLMVSELPPNAGSAAATGASKGVQLLIQHSIPVFVIPQDGQTLGARHGTTSLQPYTSQLDTQATDSSTLQMQNVGKQRVRISRVEFVDANGKSSMLMPGLLGYVLTGQTMKWQLPLPASMRQTGGRIDVRLNDDTQSQTLLQVPAGK
ncbi:molecular chaperone [Diaphorobacter sp. HDW4B]|uniref:fimbrial biogenesis chaperone n=1 Tax=Diaphorobacter sp. HDW4B TaxID=2714925 RepID=UPI00140CB5A0|nr:fimbria/pilus periplasmic chaperone [Diaphorobacter sp. HDW4B]QIL72556.1 molecular chaperone [Diaphorobacter sp. HDW4B]